MFFCFCLGTHIPLILQVCLPALRSSARNDGHFCRREDRSETIGAECFGSMQGDCVPSQFSKPYLMYSVTDAASTALDFSKENVEDGVVDSLPSCSVGRMPGYLPSLLRDCRSTPIRERSCLPTHHNVCMLQRQLYCKASLDKDEVKEKDHVHCSISVLVERKLISFASQSQAVV